MLKTQENKYMYAYVQRAHNYMQSNDTDCMTTHMAFFFVPYSSICFIYPSYSILNPQITSKVPVNPHNNPVRQATICMVTNLLVKRLMNFSLQQVNIGKITGNQGQLLPLSEMSSLTLIRGATDMTQQLKKKKKMP